MHDRTHPTDTTQLGDITDVPSATGLVTTRSLMAAINARTPVTPNLADATGDTVDIINDLSAASLVYRLRGVAPGPQIRSYELAALPDFGGGALALPPLDSGGRGNIQFVDDNGAVATGAAVTGVSFQSGAYLKSVDPLPPALDPSTGWVIRFRFRTPVGVSNSSKTWVAVGRRASAGIYGVSVTETSGGALSAVIEDPNQVKVTVRSNATPRGVAVDAAIAWNPATRLAQWIVNGIASGAAVSVPFVPEFATGRIFVGTSIAEATNSMPTGSVYGVSLEITMVGVSESVVPVGPVATLNVADAASLEIDTINILQAAPSAGSISLRFASTSGERGEDIAVGIGGYANVVERLSRFVSAETPYVGVDVGSAQAGVSSLVLTPPARGKFQTASTTEYIGTGSFVRPQTDGTPARVFIDIDPQNEGVTAGKNPAGPIPRGFTDVFRFEQSGQVREITTTELNRPPRLNGGGEAWGHADDDWVPIHALWYGYANGTYEFPTIEGEVPIATVVGIPGPGEGTIRVNRTGPDLRVGDTVTWKNTRRLGWWKRGVSSVSDSCGLRLQLTAPGSPAGIETYALKMTNASRPAAFTRWELASFEFADLHTQLRWASRGGDWTGTDGLWGSTPYHQSATVTSARTLTIDVTALVKAFGADLFLSAASTTGTVSVTPPSFPANPAIEPVLVVTGGARAGIYKATRWGLLSESSSAWKPTNTTSFAVRRTQPLLVAFDSAGTSNDLSDAARIELQLNVTGVSGGGSAVQVFRTTPRPPRPGPRVAVDPVPVAARSDLITRIDTDAAWMGMLNEVDTRNKRGSGQPDNFTVANGCFYGGINPGSNGGMSLFHGFWKPDNSGYPVIRMARMVGWHINYQPADANSGDLPNVSGKSPGPIATGDQDLSGIEVGRGGNSVSGHGGYTCRSQRGYLTAQTHKSTVPLSGFMTFGDYNYFISGLTNGGTTNSIAPLPRMKWLWIETVHATNSIYPDGSWAKDGVFELYVNGRKHCESRCLEYRVFQNSAMWDAIWFDEYNGGQDGNRVDRLWPFVVGPTYVVAGTAPIAPPAGWNVPFVGADGRPESTALAYQPDY